MTGYQLRRTVHRSSTARVLVGVALLLGCGFAFAAPTVQSIQFISGVRKESEERTEVTRCTLTYRLLVQGDVRPYRSGVFTVTTTNPALTILTNQISIPEIDAEQLLLPTTPLTVRVDTKRIVPPVKHIGRWCPEREDTDAGDRRHERHYDDTSKSTQDRRTDEPDRDSDREHHRHLRALPPFSLADFAFSFNGQVDGTFVSAGALRVGELQFLEGGGRPGHEGTFPIQGDSPPVGAALTVLATIYGGVSSATYQLVNISGQTLQSGALTAASKNAFYAGLLIPSAPFHFAISAVSSTGTTLAWQSRLYNPAAISLRILPSNDAVSPGQSMPIQLQLNSSHVLGSYVVTMYLPIGFTDTTGSQTVSVAPGTRNTLSATFTVGATVSRYQQYPIVVEAVATDPTLPTVSATLSLQVE
jgi:hypothetical protein